uniref:WRC domain-containing protein n=1 Tax=Arabidopsis thaliana TaxID=3702 RepID=Q8LFN8_ARATH|nr:unknown [Arabidopsis thaliana]
MRIRKRQVPLPLSSLLPVPLSDLYFNRSPTATERYFRGGYKDGGDDFGSLQLSLPPPSQISDRLIQRDLIKKKEEVKALDDDNGDVDVKSRSDASGSKNVNPRGESVSSIQVVEKNEKVVSLRKRRGFINFEDYEDEEDEEASGGGGRINKGKKKAKKSGGGLEEGSRCSRVNGRGWRCCQQTLVGYSLCEHHLGKGRVRSMNKSGGGRGGEKKAVVVEVKKKRVKLGMVKARSISSLLGQTSTSGGTSGDVDQGEISAPADQFAACDK